jgi:potassium efflux system protein
MTWLRPCLWSLILLSSLMAAPVQAQPHAPENDTNNAAATPDPATISPSASIQSTLTPALVETRIKEIEASSTLSEEAKSELTGQLRTVLSNLEQISSFDAKAAAYRATMETAPEEVAAILAELDSPDQQIPDPPVVLPAGASIQDVQQLLSREQAEAAANDAKIAELDKVLDDTDEQPDAIRKRISDARQALETLDADMAAAPANGGTAIEQEARRWMLETRRDALRAELLMRDQQIVSYDTRRELASASRDRLRAQQKRLRARRAYLENEADRLRRIDAERVSAESAAEQRETADAHPLIKQLVEENLALSDEIAKVTEQLGLIDEQQAKMERDTQRIREDFRSARQRLEAAGLNRALGQVLIDQRSRLPDVRSLREASEARADEIVEVTLSQIRHRDEQRTLSELDAYLDAALAGLDPSEQARIRGDLRKQVERRRDLIKRTLDVEESYRRALTELDFAADQLMDTTLQYDSFLAERLLWVRSIPPVTQQSFAALPAAVYWLVSPVNWLKALEVLRHEATRSPLLWVGLLAVLLLLWRGAAIRRAIRASADNLRRISSDRFAYTLEALGLTLLAAAPWPLLLIVLGFQLSSSLESDAFSKAIGDAMIAVGPALYYLRAFRLLCMPGGVADRHFRWNSDVLVLLRRNFAWAASLLLPIGFVAAAIHSHENSEFNGTLGRLALVGFDLGLAVFTARLVNPRTGAFHHMLSSNPHGWANRLRGLWYPAVVAVPLALGFIALTGYLYTSGTLLESLISELWMALGLVVLHQLIVRWLIVTRRRLDLQATLERRAQREAQKESGQDDDHQGAEPLSLPTQEQEVDFASLDAQTRRLLNTLIVIAAAVGLWLIWSEVLPALNIFERVTLWSYSGNVDGIEQQVPVTLADLGLIVTIIIIALAAGKNLPALLEILLLQHTSVSAGSRYTIITLTGYAITAIGTLFVFSTLGLTWGEVQWLIAALSVGIGFGLQEIVANFISGLIILFERPVRVGDIVTIGDTTGVVTRIEIRATTIRNWDKQELLVPNKEFITGRLLNWTLTDQVNRVVITVGAEYGCDTRKALQLLREVAAENPRVLDDPAPLVNFEAFDDNSLRLVLRCYLETLEYRLAVTSELHQAIDDKFRAAGIGIAFPQRDIHLRASEPLDIRLSRGARAGEPGAGG